MRLQPSHRQLVTRFLKRYIIWWYVGTVLLYAAAIPLTVLVFPATTLLLTIFVLFSGFTASVASMASALLTAEQDEQLRQNDVQTHT